MEAFLKGGTLKDAKKEKTDKAETSGTKLKGENSSHSLGREVVSFFATLIGMFTRYRPTHQKDR